MKMNECMFFTNFTLHVFHSAMHPIIHSLITNYLPLARSGYANNVTSPAPILIISGVPLLKSTTLEG